MANLEHLSIIKQGVEVWNQWRFNHIDTKIDLRGADLRNANLSGVYLLRATLLEADLSGADLRNATLFEADLYRATLFEADLSGADLRNAELTRAELTRANLSGVTNLTEATLRNANLSGADLTGALQPHFLITAIERKLFSLSSTCCEHSVEMSRIFIGKVYMGPNQIFPMVCRNRAWSGHRT